MPEAGKILGEYLDNIPWKIGMAGRAGRKVIDTNMSFFYRGYVCFYFKKTVGTIN